MKIYDISQEIFSCQIYPGDPQPDKQILSDISKGDLYNLSGFSMCAHNGTHIDAPFHFLNGGKTVEQIEMEKFIGFCYVAFHSGDLSANDAENIIKKAGDRFSKRILIKGEATVTQEAADVFSEKGVFLLGNESQSVGPEDAPMSVHITLLKKDVVLLEGIRLKDVNEGGYLLCAAPLKLKGCDGAPCRAILIEL